MVYTEFESEMYPSEAFKPEGKRMRLFGAGGGGQQPTNSTNVQTSIPDYAKPYVETMLGKSSAVTGAPFRQYPGQQVAGFSPMQQQAFGNIQSQQVAGQVGAASDMAQQSGLSALSAGSNYKPMGLSMQSVSAPNLNQYQMGPAQQVSTGSFTDPGKIASYMSPYMQNVVDIQKREANRDFDTSLQSQHAQAVGQGAFGGNRAAILETEGRRQLGRQLNDIQAQGSQAAFDTAQQGYMTDQQRQLGAQQANQGAGLTVGQQNLGAQLGTQQLGSGQQMQGQLANQSTFQQMQQQAQQAQQFGSDLGLRGAQTAAQAAGTLGQMGQEQFAQQQGINQALQGAGASQQAVGQEQINALMQNFQQQQNYPYQQLGFMSDMARGLPLSQTSQQMYQAPPNLTSQAAGLGLAGLGVYNATK